MTESEGRALARTTAILLLAGAVRWGVTARSGSLPVPADSAAALPALLDQSRREQDEAARRGTPLAEGETVDPNVASEADLDRLPGVGPVAARAIVAARDSGGGFASPEDLLNVRGIGPATLERMRPHLAFARAYVPGLAGSSVGSGPGRGARAASAGVRSGRRGPRSSAGENASTPLGLNAATKAELERLPGVGPALAQRILDERDRRGGFAQVDDLLSVRGIGAATLERLRPLVAVP